MASNSAVDRGLTTPAIYVAEITASANPLDPRPRALYIAVSGTITIGNEAGTSVSAIEVVAGSIIPIQAYKITAITSARVIGLYG